MFLRIRPLALVVVATVVGVTSAAAAAHQQRLGITSSLDGKKVLPLRIHWIARPKPARSVAKVEYLIDGQLGWVERNPPFYYGSDGNWLVTTWLKPGLHRFTVRATATSGRRTTRTTKARILPAPKPPAELAGTWSRTVTEGDAGTWHVTINRVGWLFDDPHGGGQNQDVSYPAAGKVLIRASIEKPVFGRYSRGGAFCNHEPDPPGLYTYSASGDGLTLKPVRRDCREGLLKGTWTRTR